MQGEQRDGDEGDGRVLEIVVVARRPPLARRLTSLVMVETTSPPGAQLVPSMGWSTRVDRVARSRCCSICKAETLSRLVSLAATVNTTYRATSNPIHSTSCRCRRS